MNNNDEAVELSFFSRIKSGYLFLEFQTKEIIHITKMFVVIDITKNFLVVHAIDDQDEDIFQSYSIENNKPGCLKLINLIADNAKETY